MFKTSRFVAKCLRQRIGRDFVLRLGPLVVLREFHNGQCRFSGGFAVCAFGAGFGFNGELRRFFFHMGRHAVATAMEDI